MTKHDDFDGPTAPQRNGPPGAQAARDAADLLWVTRQVHHRLAVTNILLGALCALLLLIYLK